MIKEITFFSEREVFSDEKLGMSELQSNHS